MPLRIKRINQLTEGQRPERSRQRRHLVRLLPCEGEQQVRRHLGARLRRLPVPERPACQRDLVPRPHARHDRGQLPPAGLQRLAPQWHSRAIVIGTLFGVLYAYQVRVSSVALHSLKAAYARIPAAIDETARTLGVSRWRLLTRLHAPLLKRAALAALLLVFVDVMVAGLHRVATHVVLSPLRQMSAVGMFTHAPLHAGARWHRAGGTVERAQRHHAVAHAPVLGPSSPPTYSPLSSRAASR